MSKNNHWVPLDPGVHGHMKLDLNLCVDFYSSHQVLPVLVKEIAKVGADCPIVFVKNPETGRFELVALAGLKSDKNAFIKDGRWLGISSPSVFNVRPFSMRKEDKSDKHILLVDENSASFNAHSGQNLFGKDGEPTEFLSIRINNAMDFSKSYDGNKFYIDVLSSLCLIREWKIDISFDNSESVSVSGVYLIDESAFRGLIDSDFLMLKEKGLLTAVYAQILSMQQLPRVISLSNVKG